MKKPENLKQRTKRFALDVIAFVECLPHNYTSTVIGRQLLRAGTSVGANYRAAARAKSTADFVSKMGTVEEEADECCYWLELLTDGQAGLRPKAEPSQKEAGELLAISVASINTARQRERALMRKPSSSNQATK